MSGSDQRPDPAPRGAVLWRVVGGALFAVGLVGVVAPLLPTTIFWILAVLALQRSDPALAARIRAWPRIGRGVSDFLDHGVVSVSGKIAAMVGIGASALLIAWLTPPAWPQIVALAVLAAVSLYLLTRPSRAP